MRNPSHDRKGQGEWAEVCFLWRASALGFTVSRPFGDNARYDFVVDAGACLFRVQVKSVSVIDRNAYRIAASTGSRIKHGYTAADIDFLAAYVIPCDAWYIIPVQAFDSIVTLRLAPHRRSNCRFEKYREAWQLLAASKDGAEPALSDRREAKGPSGLHYTSPKLVIPSAARLAASEVSG